MNKTRYVIRAAGIGTAFIAGASHAQSVTYDILATSVPTMSEYGMLAMSLLILAAGIYYMKTHRDATRRLLSLLVVAAGASMIYAKSDMISSAWAVAVYEVVTRSSPVLLETNNGIHSITNGAGQPIKIRALVDGGGCTVAPSTNDNFMPACDVNVQVAPGSACHVYVDCSPGA
jgi:hypothetical protein